MGTRIPHLGWIQQQPYGEMQSSKWGGRMPFSGYGLRDIHNSIFCLLLGCKQDVTNPFIFRDKRFLFYVPERLASGMH
jgi:hypothetical protein